MTANALYKLTAAHQIPFEQDGPGCRLWFKRADLDAWRRTGNGSGPTNERFHIASIRHR